MTHYPRSFWIMHSSESSVVLTSNLSFQQAEITIFLLLFCCPLSVQTKIRGQLLFAWSKEKPLFVTQCHRYLSVKRRILFYWIRRKKEGQHVSSFRLRKWVDSSVLVCHLFVEKLCSCSESGLLVSH